MFFTFPKDARWNAERQAVEFGVEPRRVFPAATPGAPPERCVEAYRLLRTRFDLRASPNASCADAS